MSFIIFRKCVTVNDLTNFMCCAFSFFFYSASKPELLRLLEDEDVPAVEMADSGAERVVGVVDIEVFPDPPAALELEGAGAKDCELLKFLMINSTSVIMASAIWYTSVSSPLYISAFINISRTSRWNSSALVICYIRECHTR